MHCRRAGDEGALVMRPKRANVCRPMVFDGGFRVREADAETDGKCHRGQARRARQEPDALRFEREIRVFPALAQTSTKNHCGHNAEASVRRVCGWNEVEDTVSPLTALGRFGRLGAKRKGIQVWRGRSGQY